MYQSHIEVHLNVGILDSSNKLSAGKSYVTYSRNPYGSVYYT